MDPLTWFDTLVAKQLAQETHSVDAGYVDATLLVESPWDFHMTLMGPARPDSSWQAKNEQAYDISQFHIDWEVQQVTCPRDQMSSTWSTRQGRWQHPDVPKQRLPHTICRCGHRMSIKFSKLSGSSKVRTSRKRTITND